MMSSGGEMPHQSTLSETLRHAQEMLGKSLGENNEKLLFIIFINDLTVTLLNGNKFLLAEARRRF